MSLEKRNAEAIVFKHVILFLLEILQLCHHNLLSCQIKSKARNNIYSKNELH